MKRELRQLAFGALLLLAAACLTYRPLTAPRSAEGKLRITFVVPHDVRLDRESATSDTLRDVWRLEGHLRAIVADTLRVAIDDAYDSRGKKLAAAGQTAIVPIEGTIIEERRMNTGMTLAAGAGLVLLLSTAAIVLLIATLVKAAR
jgi:hypothetical protein